METVTFVTTPAADPVGAAWEGTPTTGTPLRSPDVLVKPKEIQQKVPGTEGFLTYHHAPSGLFPTISAVSPGFKTITTDQSTPGPERQLRGWPFGEPSGMVDVGSGPVGVLAPPDAAGVPVAPELIPIAELNGQLHARMSMAASAE